MKALMSLAWHHDTVHPSTRCHFTDSSRDIQVFYQKFTWLQPAGGVFGRKAKKICLLLLWKSIFWASFVAVNLGNLLHLLAPIHRSRDWPNECDPVCSQGCICEETLKKKWWWQIFINAYCSVILCLWNGHGAIWYCCVRRHVSHSWLC